MDLSKVVIAAALAATAVPSAAAPVSPATNPPGSALILVPLTLTKIDDLEFGSVIPSGMSGTVAINATTGARSIAGGVTGLPSDPGKRAYFAGAGSPNHMVIVEVSAPTELTSTTNATDELPVLALTLDGSPIRTIDGTTRAFFFGIGGIIQINANQPEGLYEATFDVTATYL